MSLLPATSHRDPANAFWATNTGGALSSISAGAGITVTNPSGPVATVTNNGVVSVVAGTGIGASGTNTVTLSNTGVTSIIAGAGINVSGATGAVTISNNGSSDIWPLPSASTPVTTGTVPFSVGTQALTKTYTYAEGFGVIQTTGGLFGSAPTITIYLSSGGSALPIDTNKAVGYILIPQVPATGVTNLTGYFYDLSAIKHYDPAGFTSITMTVLTTTSGTGFQFSPVITTQGMTNVTTTDAVTTKTSNARAGGAGFKFFTNV